MASLILHSIKTGFGRLPNKEHCSLFLPWLRLLKKLGTANMDGAARGVDNSRSESVAEASYSHHSREYQELRHAPD
jgi:hypothetical protein